MEGLHFAPLSDATAAIAEAFTRWENDPLLIPLSRPNRDQADLERHHSITADELAQRAQHQPTYLIYLNDRLIGEMNYQIDPAHLYRKEPGTAWIGITIGEEVGRGKGFGGQALRYLEKQIALHGFQRIELGVFEFNTPAFRLYQKLSYTEIGRLEGFTYWQGRMWQDIRMEKYLS
jgi:RimJ/RimL family protein N-acetyltransferase